MFFKNLKLKSDVTLSVTLAQVHLPVRLGHRDANEIFAGPLANQMAAAGLGTVMECHVHEKSNAGVRGVDLFIGLTDCSREAMQTIARMLEHLAAPCGSSIRLNEGLSEPLVFGKAEGLELSIDANITPDEDARRDLALVCRDALANLGVSRGWSEDQNRTNFYFYGNNLAAMRDNLKRILQEYPQYQGALLRRMA